MGIICLYVLIQKSGQKTAKSHQLQWFNYLLLGIHWTQALEYFYMDFSKQFSNGIFNFGSL